MQLAHERFITEITMNPSGVITGQTYRGVSPAVFQSEGDFLIINDNLDLEYSMISELPSNLIVKGNVNLNNTSRLKKIGDNIQIDGNLNLEESAITSLGKNLKVGGDFFIRRCRLRTVPADLIVTGTLDMDKLSKWFVFPDGFRVRNNLKIHSSDIGNLLSGLQVAGNLELSFCGRLKRIDHLNVGGELRISNCEDLSELTDVKTGKDLFISSCCNLKKIKKVEIGQDLRIIRCDLLKSFPEEISIGRSIIFYNSSIKAFPEGLEIKGDLSLSNCEHLNELPDDLKVGGCLSLTDMNLAGFPRSIQVIHGDLELNNTEFTKWPDDLVVEGNLRISNVDLTDLSGVFKVQRRIISKPAEKVAFRNNQDIRDFLIDNRLVTEAQIETDGTRLIINGDVDLRDLEIESLMVNLLINGDLLLTRSTITNWDSVIITNGKLDFYYAVITDINGSLHIGKDGKFYQTRIESINGEFIVHGDLKLFYSKLKKLPEKLIVSGNLYMKKNEIEKWPEVIDVGGNLDISIEGEQLPQQIRVAQNAEIWGLSLAGLKEITVQGNLGLHKLENVTVDITVGGSLSFEYSKLKKLGGKIKVAGDLNLANNKELTELSADMEIGKRLILKNSGLNAVVLNKAVETGCLPDKTIIEQDLIIAPKKLVIKKIGDQVRIYGNVVIDSAVIEGIGDNLVVYGNLLILNSQIDRVGGDFKVFGSLKIERSRVGFQGTVWVEERLAFIDAEVEFADQVQASFIFNYNSKVQNCGVIGPVYQYDDFRQTFQSLIDDDQQDVQIEREVQEYYKIGCEIEALRASLGGQYASIVETIMDLEKLGVLEQYLTFVDKFFRNTTYRSCIRFDWDGKIISCYFDLFTKKPNYIIELNDFYNVQEALATVDNEDARERLKSLFDLILTRILIRDLALLRVNKKIGLIKEEVKKWRFFKDDDYYDDYDEDDDDDDEIEEDEESFILEVLFFLPREIPNFSEYRYNPDPGIFKFGLY